MDSFQVKKKAKEKKGKREIPRPNTGIITLRNVGRDRKRQERWFEFQEITKFIPVNS